MLITLSLYYWHKDQQSKRILWVKFDLYNKIISGKSIPLALVTFGTNMPPPTGFSFNDTIQAQHRNSLFPVASIVRQWLFAGLSI